MRSDGEQHEGEAEVHHRTAEHDDDAFADRKLVEHPVDGVGRDLLERLLSRVVDQRGEPPGGRGPQHRAVGARRGRVHPDHADVAAEGHGLDAVLRLAAVP
jgi:hypothetical protein